MEAFTDGLVRVTERELERLGDIVSVDVVHRLHPFVRKLQHFTASNASEYVRIEMPGGIHRLPARSHQMTRVKNHGARMAPASFVEEKRLDRGLLDSIIAERVSRILFGRGHCRCAPVHPHRAAMKEERLTRL